MSAPWPDSSPARSNACLARSGGCAGDPGTGARAPRRSPVRGPGVSTLGVIALVAVAGGCGSGDAGTSAEAGASTGAFLTCATEKRAIPYQAGMEVASSVGLFEVKLLDSVPGPPVKGNNTWTIEIDDASGAALDGLTVSVSPWMPDHGHGTQPVLVTSAGSGRYDLAPVYLYMSGFWQVPVLIKSPTGATGTQDQATIPICIP